MCQERARAIVKLAATMTEVEPLRQWVNDDSTGSCERDAALYLAHVKPEIAKTMTETEVNSAIATEIILRAALAMVSSGPWKPQKTRR